MMSSVERKKLIWRCRRGTRELDRLLMRFVQRHYDSASPERQNAFLQLLDLPDPVLQNLLMGTMDESFTIESSAIKEVIRLIRERRTN